MKAEQECELIKLIHEDAGGVIDVLLKTYWWPKDIETRGEYMRYEDDSMLGNLSVCFSDDADAWIEVYQERDPEDFNGSLRFRMPFTGGGQSPRVRNALLILAEAIRMDNLDHPQHRGRKTTPP